MRHHLGNVVDGWDGQLERSVAAQQREFERRKLRNLRAIDHISRKCRIILGVCLENYLHVVKRRRDDAGDACYETDVRRAEGLGADFVAGKNNKTEER